VLISSQRAKAVKGLFLLACLIGQAGLACFAEQGLPLHSSHESILVRLTVTPVATARSLNRTRTVSDHRSTDAFLPVWLAWRLWFNPSGNFTGQVATRISSVFLLTTRGRSPPQSFLV